MIPHGIIGSYCWVLGPISHHRHKARFSTPICTKPIFDPNNGACVGPVTTQITSFDLTSAAYIKDIFSKLPAPNANGVIVSSAANHYDFRGETVRIDHTFGPSYSVFGRFMNNEIPTGEPGGLFAGLPLPGVATTNTNAPGKGLAVRFTPALSDAPLGCSNV